MIMINIDVIHIMIYIDVNKLIKAEAENFSESFFS